MPRRTQNMNSMSRGRVRSSMNKYNLFNLYKKPAINYQGKTLYQQKWTAKQETRAYHGEHLTERRWKQLFNPNLESVAQLDASLKGVKVDPTPMPLQSFASLEKRLEFALFRAMFSSSVRQAREFILGGHVQVNGVVIKHPSFPLRAGDVFSVEPDKVLLAMGRVKPGLQQALKVDNKQIAVWNKYVKSAKENPRDVWELKQTKPKSLNLLEEGVHRKDEVKKYNDVLDKQMIREQNGTTREAVLAKILELGNDFKGESLSPIVFKEFGDHNSNKCLDLYQKLVESKHILLRSSSLSDARSFISRKSTEFETKEEAKLASVIKQILGEVVKSRLEEIRISAQNAKLPESAKSIPLTPSFFKNLSYHPKLDKEAALEDESKVKVSLPWQKGLFGREDPSKLYFTPWTPRPFIGCFAILPSHLEISFSTCHAIYLRDPIARPGHSEVITPFPDHVHERAYMFYARKGM
ncbi:uncharacterized protein PRCAT00001704001 [Priceomyces carsonii]|uniref:uncharacterized protein n=1 Tax=Priceomyces carsonii TaxID=28549 RepID=UPI002ED94844|nr:unnamed protein product [Priceomyces carsonii]